MNIIEEVKILRKVVDILVELRKAEMSNNPSQILQDQLVRAKQLLLKANGVFGTLQQTIVNHKTTIQSSSEIVSNVHAVAAEFTALLNEFEASVNAVSSNTTLLTSLDVSGNTVVASVAQTAPVVAPVAQTAPAPASIVVPAPAASAPAPTPVEHIQVSNGVSLDVSNGVVTNITVDSTQINQNGDAVITIHHPDHIVVTANGTNVTTANSTNVVGPHETVDHSQEKVSIKPL